MLRRRDKNGRKAQVFLEYIIIVGVVILVLMAMSTMIKRGTQGMIKVVADQIGIQENADQRFDPNESFLENAYIATRGTSEKTRDEFVGTINYIFRDVMQEESTKIINMGFTNEN